MSFDLDFFFIKRWMHNLKELKQTKNVFVVETVFLFLSQFAMTILTHLILGMQKSCKCKMKFQSRSTKTDFESKNIYYQTKKKLLFDI